MSGRFDAKFLDDVWVLGPLYKWLRGLFGTTKRRTRSGIDGEEEDGWWQERHTVELRIQDLLKQSPHALTVVQGPKGSGKSELVRKATRPLHLKLTVKCDELVGQRDVHLLAKLAEQVGFFPAFGSIAQVSSWGDALITASTGAKAGLAVTKEAEITKILDCITVVLQSFEDKRHVQRENGLPVDTCPTIVLDDFLAADGHYLYAILGKWAGFLVEHELCHVVMITDQGSMDAIEKIMPSRTVETFVLQDAPDKAALQFLTSRLSRPADELAVCVGGVGGRFSDLEQLVQKLKTGKSASQSLEEMISRAVTELLRTGLESRDWSDTQFWHVATSLASKGVVNMDELRMHALFKGSILAVEAMARRGLVVLVVKDNRVQEVRAGKKLYQSGFERLVKDDGLCKVMARLTSKQLVKEYELKMSVIAAELGQLGVIPSGWFGGGVSMRVQGLQNELEQLERKRQAALK